MSEMNVNVILEELKKAGLSWHDLIDVTERTIRSEYRKKYRIWIEDKELDRYNIETIDKELNKIHDKHVSTFGDMETAKVFYEFKQLSFSLSGIDDKTITFHRFSSSSNAEIISLIRYAVIGQFDEDYHEANKLLDGHDPRITYDSMIWQIDLNWAGDGKTWDITQIVTIKSFKNGNIKVTGLNVEQKNRIKAGFDIVEKYHNVQ